MTTKEATVWFQCEKYLDACCSMKPTKKPSPNRGRAVNLYLNPKDEGKISALRTFIATNGHKVNDTQVVKAAQRVAEPNKKLLQAFNDVLDSAPRRKPSAE
ncbi:MAG: hypothetical protein WA426_06385 [Silvibacterium sp.]